MTSPAAPTIQPASVWEDLVDIFYAPREVFARRRSSGYAVPLIVLIVVLTLLFLAGRPLFQSLIDSDAAREMTRRSMSAAAIENAKEWSAKMAVLSRSIGVLVYVFLLGAVMMGVARLFDVKLSYKASCMIATYSGFPLIVRDVLGVVQGYLLSPDTLTSQHQISLSLARFVDPDATSPAVIALLAQFDVIGIWMMVLVGIGVAVVGGTTRQRAILIAATLWLLGGLFTVGMALRS